ncbi:hypothetical protein PF66_06391 [Pseudomonas asplenii]|uniref:Uncharacterized protein n=1 Tax=Pseudomonas asplenii TaxID=53407 RepID=A0A0M9GBP2_9PSED|nr:hypothetical protein PF66_06391 [Pseudomonas fuscovaginae]
MSLIDTQELKLICDGCSHHFSETVGDVKLNDRWTKCPSCGRRDQVDKAGFEAVIAAGEKQIADLQAKVRSVGENLFKGGN